MSSENAPTYNVMIIAGESSGDQHGAAVATAMRQQWPRIRFVGIGGPAMRAAGVELAYDAADLSVVGVTEALGRLPAILRGVSAAKRLLANERPHLLILIDFPDFNLHVAARAKKLRIPVLYYISPQIWAWRSSRVRQIKQRVDHMAVILPFEAAFYRRHHVPVTYVGHPLLEHRQPSPRRMPDHGRSPVVGLLPGSRYGEVRTHLPVLIAAARRLQAHIPRIRFVVSIAPMLEADPLADSLAGIPVEPAFKCSRREISDIFSQCHMVIAVSGTVTLQAAIARVPMVIIYRVSPISFWIGKLLIKVRSVGLANLIAPRPFIPELIQHDATADKIVEMALPILTHAPTRRAMVEQLGRVCARLGHRRPSAHVARLALQLIRNHAVGW